MNVVLDLVAEILFHFSLNLIFVERIDRSGINPVSAEKLPMTLIKLPERSVRPLSINSEGRSEFEAVGKRIIPCGPNLTVSGARRNAQVIERKITLFVQADRRLGAILFSIKQPEKLPKIFPIPSSVAYVHEAFVLDLTLNLTERWERVRRRRTFRPKLFLLRKPERTNPGENFQPGQKEPAQCGEQPPHPTVGHKINGEKSGRENAERTGFLCIRILKGA